MRPGLGLLLLVLCACGDGSNAPRADQLIFPRDFATTYQPVRNCRLSNAHDLHFISVYASPETAADYLEGDYPLAEGAILVKALHDDPTCATPVGYVAMRKDGDWTWQETEADFTSLASGPLQSCIGCHTACADRDFTCTDP